MEIRRLAAAPLIPQFVSPRRVRPGLESEAGPLRVVETGGVGPSARDGGPKEVFPEKGRERGQSGPFLREVWKDSAQLQAQILMGLFSWSKGWLDSGMRQPGRLSGFT